VKATEVTAGLAESNGSLLPGMWRDSLHVTCGLTACTPGSAPGPTLGYEYGKTLRLPFLHFTERLCHYPPKYQRFILQQSFSPNTSLIKGLHGILIIPTINLLFSVRFATGYIHSGEIKIFILQRGVERSAGVCATSSVRELLRCSTVGYTDVRVSSMSS